MPKDDISGEESVSDALSGRGGDGEVGIVGKTLKLFLPAGIVIVFAIGGFFASSLNTPATAGAEDTESTGDPESTGSGTSTEGATFTVDAKDRRHHELEAIVVNLNEPQVTRYLRAGFSLAFAKSDFDAAVAILNTKSHDIRDWLISYLSNLAIEDIRGSKSINRVRREIQDMLNDRIWPGERPRVVNVSLSEWIVQ